MRAALFVTCLVEQFLAEIGLSMVHGTGSHKTLCRFIAKDGATQIVFRASPAQSVIFPAMIDQPALTRIRSGLIQELMLA